MTDQRQAGACLAPTAAGYAELAGRLPVSVGEAAYVRAGFNSKTMGQLAGWLVIFAGTFASAAVADGSVAYLREFIDLPPSTLVVLVVLVIGLIAAWSTSPRRPRIPGRRCPARSSSRWESRPCCTSWWRRSRS